MPRKSIEALSALQQRSIDALKVAQSAQLHAMRAARQSAAPAILPAANYVTDVAISLTYSLLAQQFGLAKQLVSVFVPASKSSEKSTTVEASVSPAIERTSDAVVDMDFVSPTSAILVPPAPIIEGSLDLASDATPAIGATRVEAAAAAAETAVESDVSPSAAEALDVTATPVASLAELGASAIAQAVDEAATPVAPIAQPVDATAIPVASDVEPEASPVAAAIGDTATPVASLVQLDASLMSQAIDVTVSPVPSLTGPESVLANIVAGSAVAADHDDAAPAVTPASIESAAVGLGRATATTTFESASNEDVEDGDAIRSVVAPMYAESVRGEIAGSTESRHEETSIGRVLGAPDGADLRKIVVANASLVHSPAEIVAKTIGAPKGAADLPGSAKPVPPPKKKAPSVSGNGAPRKRGLGNKAKRTR